jgi:hypothetical protein
MTIDEIQSIISYSYPLIQKYYGKGKLPIPKIDTSHKNTYAMHSGEPEATGEHDATSIAEYYEGTIYLYLPNIPNEEELLRSIIHEYTHYLQGITPFKTRVANQEYEYEDNPYEQEAHENEENWETFSQK